MRVFVAAWPDEPTRERLAALELAHPKNLRLVGPTRWHVTLRFLGDVTDDELARLGRALQAGVGTQRGPLECRLGPATAWFSRVRVLQVPARGLAGLAAVVERATAPLVPEREAGEPPFNGHLTLARVKGRLAPQARAELQGIPFDAAFAVTAVDLVASEPSPRGHVYTTLARAPLGIPA
ncbi:MAG TPA: RNA 2',3'-cyclic phosphodiesterase [Acidimicrobiales bacterium]|nr:RNA 2',3'-cyclic phosphodiesterase [Acidimicrobiales bacterium]